MPERLVVCEGLSYTYPNGVQAICEINLSIDPGEIIGIVGANGAGKTTLLKHFNGLLQPTSGRVLVDGLDTRDHRVEELSRIVGLAFQNPRHQIFANSVAAELAFGLTHLGWPAEQLSRRVQEVMDLFQLGEWQGHHPAHLPYGICKLIGVASVFAILPKVLVLDEPTTGQDLAGVRLVGRTISRMQELGAAIVISSHDVDFIAEWCDRTLVMSQAHLIADARTRQVFDNSELLQTAGLKPPQITELMWAVGRKGHSAVISVDEAVPIISERWRDHGHDAACQ